MWQNGTHPPMPPRERAKQFMPFAAVRGLEQALRERERQTQARVELQPDEAEAIDRTLRAARAGDRLRVCIFVDGCYLTKTVCVHHVDALNGVLVTEGGERLVLSDLRAVEVQ